MFVEVVRQGGFSQAAKVVFASQPTVSKAVRQLGEELGVPLLNRIGHRSLLTSAGEIVYRRALGLITAGNDLLAELDELQGLRRGTLRIGLPLLGSSAFFAPVFASFRRRYPGVEVELSSHPTARLEEMLQAGELDLAAVLQPLSRELDWQDFRIEPLVVLLPPNHALANQKAIKLPKLVPFPFILFEEGFATNEMILEACRHKGITPKIAAHSRDVDFVFELVASGVGIAFLSRAVAERRPHLFVRSVLLDEPKCRWRIVLAWRRDGYLSHAARAWLAHARDFRLNSSAP